MTIGGLYRNIPIRKKILLALYILISIPLLTVGIMSYDISAGAMESKAVEYTHDMLSIIRYRLIDLLKGIEYISQDLMYNDSIYQTVIKKSFSTDRIYLYEQHKLVTGELKKVLLARDEIKSALILSFNGSTYPADNNKDKLSITEQVDVVDMLAKARQMRGRPQWYVNRIEGMENNVFLLRLVSNRENYTEAGLMILGVNKDYLTEAFKNLESDYVQNLAVIDSEGMVVFSSSPDAAKTIMDLGFHGTGEGYEFDRDNRVMKAYLSIDHPDWRIATYVPYDRIYDEIYSLRRRIILVCVIVFLAISVIGWLVARDIINPISSLVKQMRRLQAGETKALVEIDRQDEFGYLGQVYNKMVNDMDLLMNNIYREQITRKEAELKALQSQMNPHFLFNTLESINWMAQMRDIPEISETVTNLSSLIEAGIGRDSKLISLQEEFSYIDQYIYIIKRRLGERLEFRCDMEDSVMQVQIPRLLVQPVVENAVYHGIERVRRNGIIELTARAKDNRLVITVYDNGAGISAEDLERLKERLAMNDDDYFRMIGEKGKSVGIENVNRRIKLFYGQEYGLNIESEEGQYTKMTMTIPMEIKKGMEGYYVQSDNH
jgi:two-component system sensor histidine kinase YesM